MIYVSEKDLAIIKNILTKYVQNGRVMAFGSRYKGTHKEYSDLDIAIDINCKMTLKELCDIKEAFEESTLSYRVDVLDYNGISSEFKAVIDKGFEVVLMMGEINS